MALLLLAGFYSGAMLRLTPRHLNAAAAGDPDHRDDLLRFNPRRRRDSAAGCIACVTKPHRPRALLTELREHLA
jgi:hypothetical protein